MIVFLQYLMLIFGFLLAGLCGLMPLQSQFFIPDIMRMFMFIIGFFIGLVGVILVHMRMLKTGTIHLVNPAGPGKINWFYIYRDGSIKITPSMRVVEGQLYSKELDAQIHDMKSYKIFDHTVRFVPEGIGHAVDLDMCLYAAVLKNKWGLSNIREGRKKIFGVKRTKPMTSKEVLIAGGDFDKNYHDLSMYESDMKNKISKGGIVGQT